MNQTAFLFFYFFEERVVWYMFLENIQNSKSNSIWSWLFLGEGMLWSWFPEIYQFHQNFQFLVYIDLLYTCRILLIFSYFFFCMLLLFICLFSLLFYLTNTSVSLFHSLIFNFFVFILSFSFVFGFSLLFFS